MKLFYQTQETPFATLHGIADSEKLVGLFFKKSDLGILKIPGTQIEIVKSTNPVLKLLQRQLNEYFRGQRREFDIPLLLTGTDFQIQAWKQLLNIPWGHTQSYSSQARAIGKPGAVRAVGSANGANKFPLLLPCHRVVRSDGSLGGYAGGLKLKSQLLEFETQGKLR